jgi:pseudouridylate synthase
MRADHVRMAAEVLEARSAFRPLVALESTVIAQGLPYPENLETARASENAVRTAGATPATIAVLDGVIHVGLTDAELARIAQANIPQSELIPGQSAEFDRDRGLGGRDYHLIVKASRRDLAAVITQARSAATTVSATLQIARRLALDPLVMATGGLGGVHRGASVTFDISTDLDELARADGAVVVCSGFKSILDVPATLEAMESCGVLLVGYCTNELPGFITRGTGLPLEYRVDSPAEAAALACTHRALAQPGAFVLVQPVPAANAMRHDLMQEALDSALKHATQSAISGKALTPFLLDAIRRQTGGLSLAANRALLVANARLAGEIAVALSALGAQSAPES